MTPSLSQLSLERRDHRDAVERGRSTANARPTCRSFSLGFFIFVAGACLANLAYAREDFLLFQRELRAS